MTILNAQGAFHVKAQTAYMQRGVASPTTLWYAGVQNQSGLATAVPGVDVILALPLVLSRPATLNKISFEVTTGGGAGSKGRAGIYRATSLQNLYPSSLVVDGGEFDCTTIAVKTTSGLSVYMSPGLYYTVVTFGVASPTVRRYGSGSASLILGVNQNLLTLNSIFNLARAYGALPATFTAGSVPIGSVANVAVALELS